MKLGDVDPRGDPRRCTRISGKARDVGRGVLAAIRASFPRTRNDDYQAVKPGRMAWQSASR
jgi:xanthine dehydrogenase accessory factor